MGPSGSGKSTLLNLLGALDTPTSGEIYFHGEPLSKMKDLDRFRARELGFVFQSFHLLPTLTAAENVQIPMFEGDLPAAERVAASIGGGGELPSADGEQPGRVGAMARTPVRGGSMQGSDSTYGAAKGLVSRQGKVLLLGLFVLTGCPGSSGKTGGAGKTGAAALAVVQLVAVLALVVLSTRLERRRQATTANTIEFHSAVVAGAGS